MTRPAAGTLRDRLDGLTREYELRKETCHPRARENRPLRIEYPAYAEQLNPFGGQFAVRGILNCSYGMMRSENDRRGASVSLRPSPRPNKDQPRMNVVPRGSDGNAASRDRVRQAVIDCRAEPSS